MNALANRAWSQITIKSIDEDQRILEGIATTPSTDLDGDVIDPMGGEYQVPMPFLMDHGENGSDDSVGHVIWAKPNKNGIPVRIKVLKDPALPHLDKAWAKLKLRLVSGLSIGFKPIEWEPIKGSFGRLYKKWKWLELSGVVIPANADASIQTIKSFDTKQRAAPGQRLPSVPSPGASGNRNAASSGNNPRSQIMKTLAELRALRETKAARLEELVSQFKSAEHQATDEEKAEFDTLSTEIDGLDQDIRIKGFESRQAGGANPVAGGNSSQGSNSRSPMGFVKTLDPEDKFKGQSYTRLLIAKAASFCALKDGNYISPAEVAKHRWGKTHPKLVEFIKAAVAGGGTGSGEWGAELAQSDARFTGDFIEFLHGLTVFDRLPLRSIPARVHVKGQDGAATGYWVGESKAIPVSKPDFSDVELTPLKVAAIATCSKELLKDSSPSAEMLIRDSVAEASAQRVDTTFLSSSAAVSGVSPAGILNGLTAVTPSGTDAAAVRADMMSLYTAFLSAKNASGLVQIMTPSMAKALALMVNALGQTEFAGINADGGMLLGDKVYTGDNVTAGDWILLKPSDIWKIGDGGIEVSMSDTATVEQNDAPQGAGDTPTAASATLINLWQEDMVGFKVTRRINYAKRRSGSVQYLSNAEYGGVVS